MITYGKDECIKGRKPSNLSSLALLSRTRLIENMRNEPLAVKIIEAPAFYGKTTLAYQYINSLAPEKKIDWVDASQKAFLRALSTKELLRSLCLSLGVSDVIVFDALPKLDIQSSRVFSFLVSYLVKQQCEIIVTSRETPDISLPDSSLLRLNVQDLLLDGAELAEAKRCFSLPDAQFAKFETIPFVSFHASKNINTFASYITGRTNQNSLLLFEVFVLCFRQGSKAELSALFCEEFVQQFSCVAHALPHCGLNLDFSTFEALSLSLYDRCNLLQKNLAEFVSVSLCANAEEFLKKMIDLLVKLEQFTFALLITKNLLSADQQLDIFQNYGRLCVRQGYSKELVEIVEQMGEGKLQSEIDLLCYAQALSDIDNKEYCNLVLTRVGDLYRKNQPELPSLSEATAKDFSIDVLGGFKITRSGEPFPAKGSVRTKARILLTLLVINHKRELSRNWLGRVLWPDSSEEKSRQNFYNLWSYTRKLFERGKGNCPYFISSSHSIRLNVDYVDSDVFSLEKICNDLLNSRMPALGYADSLEWIERTCCSSLLPGSNCPEISAQSNVLRNRLVDALMLASESLTKQQNGQLSLRFVQKAFLCDSSREDSCYVLMKMLMAMGQYSKAINVFMRHKNTMIDKYGVENSKRVSHLYEEILKELS